MSLHLVEIKNLQNLLHNTYVSIERSFFLTLYVLTPQSLFSKFYCYKWNSITYSTGYSEYGKINCIFFPKYEKSWVFVYILIINIFLNTSNIGLVVFGILINYFCFKNHVLQTNDMLSFLEEPIILLLKSWNMLLQTFWKL